MLVKIYTENPSEKEIDRVVNLLERGRRGDLSDRQRLCLRLLDPFGESVERLRRIKGKDLTTFPSCSIRSGRLPTIAGWITLSSGC